MMEYWRIRGVLALLLLLGCSAAEDESKPAGAGPAFAPSGFLGDYTELRSGGEGRARLGYLDSAVDFSGYTHVIIDPVVVWKSDEARFAGVAQTQRELLARELRAEMRQAFAPEFQIAEAKPTPNTLRVRCALTAAIAASGSSDPGPLDYLEIEFELLDAVTQKRLAAAVDSKGRIGSTRAGPQPVEARAAFRDWAERATIRVAAMRSLDRRYGQPESP
jgi:hypothetical protein